MVKNDVYWNNGITLNKSRKKNRRKRHSVSIKMRKGKSLKGVEEDVKFARRGKRKGNKGKNCIKGRKIISTNVRFFLLLYVFINFYYVFVI